MSQENQGCSAPISQKETPTTQLYLALADVENSVADGAALIQSLLVLSDGLEKHTPHAKAIAGIICILSAGSELARQQVEDAFLAMRKFGKEVK